MAVTELIYGVPIRATVGVVQFDASISEVHSDSSEVTDHPVEEGSDITDHIRKLPSAIEINGRITNTPIVLLASVFAKSPIVDNLVPSVGTRVFDGYQELLNIQAQGIIVDVITSLRDYENMAITNVQVNRDKDTGNVLDATISLREVVIANSISVSLPVPLAVANKPKVNKGKKPPNASSDGQTETAASMLSQLFG